MLSHPLISLKCYPEPSYVQRALKIIVMLLCYFSRHQMLLEGLNSEW